MRIYEMVSGYGDVGDPFVYLYYPTLKEAKYRKKQYAGKTTVLIRPLDFKGTKASICRLINSIYPQ